MSPPVSVQADVPNKLIQMAVWTLTLHPPRETHQAVDVLYVCSHLETLHVLKQRSVYRRALPVLTGMMQELKRQSPV